MRLLRLPAARLRINNLIQKSQILQLLIITAGMIELLLVLRLLHRLRLLGSIFFFWWLLRADHSWNSQRNGGNFIILARYF